MTFVEFVGAKAKEVGLGLTQVHSESLVTIDIHHPEGEVATILIKPRGETIHGEPIIELSTYAFQPYEDEDLNHAINRTLLALNSSGRIFHWGLEQEEVGEWYVAYARLIVPGMTAHAFEMAIASLANAKTAFFNQIRRRAQEDDLS